jgi:hypothetical protein
MKNYTQFIKEQNETKISIQDIYNSIKEIFAKDDVLSTDSVYEQGNNSELRLIISINKLYTKNQLVIYTKLMFSTDNTKSFLTSNTFKYLYEINCDFKEETFNDINDFKIIHFFVPFDKHKNFFLVFFQKIF